MFVHGLVYIRSIEERDLEFLAECRNSMSTWKYLGTIDFANKIKQLEWWKTSSLDKTQSNFVLCSFADNEPVGFVRTDEIDHFNKSIRIGGDIHPDFRGKGYGTTMYDLILYYCFNQLNMNRVWLLVLDFNKVAIELYHKMGLRIEGIQRKAIYRSGQYHNYLSMSILKSEYNG